MIQTKYQEFSRDDSSYLTWVNQHPVGYVINTERSRNPNYMVLHRTNCWTINRLTNNAEPGGFTERQYIKICADDVAALRAWARENGRPDGSFTKLCSICRPDDIKKEQLVETALSLHTDIFTVEAIMTPKEWVFSWPLGSDLTMMQSQRRTMRYDLVPASYEGEIVGLYLKGDDEPQPLTRQWLVSRDTPISELLGLFADTKRPGFLVLHGQDVVGIVTSADLNKLSARIYIYNLIGELELGLANLIGQQFTTEEDILSLLSESRQAILKDQIKEIKAGNVDIDPVELLYLSDLVNIVAKSENFRLVIGFSSRSAAEKELNGLVDLRASVMHFVRPFLKQIPEDLIKQHARVKRMRMILRRLS